MTLFFITDKDEYNTRYRLSLRQLLLKSGYNVLSFGIFEGILNCLRFIYMSPFHTNDIFISSNLRTNLLILLLPWLRGVIILNGVGRYRKNKLVRYCLIVLFVLNKRKEFIIQSYADYRYFSRYTGVTYIWIPGSGGKSKFTGKTHGFVCVQRDDKIDRVSKSLKVLIEYLEPNCDFHIVGCDNAMRTKEILSPHNVDITGFVPQDDIFKTGGRFVQPTGYGEGFPHTLSDAIVSGMDVVIAKPEYLRCGLHRLGSSSSSLVPGWLVLEYDTNVQRAVSETAVNDAYKKVIEGLL